MIFVKKLKWSLPAKLDFFLVSSAGILFSFAMSPSVVESFAITSGDDGPILPAEALKNEEVYSKIGVSRISNELVLMWTTLTKWFPALSYKFFNIDPALFHILFVYSQITLILLGCFRLSQSFKFSRKVGYVSVLLIIIYESYFINMGAYGGQTWMPYTTWIAVGPLLFSWANFIDNNKFKGLILLGLGTLIHPGMGLAAVILIIATQNILTTDNDKFDLLRLRILILGTVLTISFFTTLPIRLEQLKPAPVSWENLDIFHWAAWNLTNGQSYYQQSKYTLIFTISMMVIATVYRDALKRLYYFLIAVISATTISVMAQALFYTFNLRQFSSINFARTTIFCSIFLTIVASKILLMILEKGHNHKISKTSILIAFTLSFPSSAGLLINNIFLTLQAYRIEQSKKYFLIISGLTLTILPFYVSNLFDTDKDTGNIFIKDLNFYMPGTLSFRAVYSYLDRLTIVFMLIFFLIFLYIRRRYFLEFVSIFLVSSLALITVYGRFTLSNIRFKENSDWINTQLWVKNNSISSDVFIHTGKYNLYGAWTTLTRRVIIDADSNRAGGLYLYSKLDEEYELIRESLKPDHISPTKTEEFEKYLNTLAEKFDAYYLVSSRSEVKYSFERLYSNPTYTIYKIEK